MKRYADVALPVNIDRLFTYLIPPELEQSALIGMRTIVPFGRKYATGLIVDLPESTPVSTLKPLHDILDPAPIISEELLSLCRWIAGYYFSPLGEVLKAAMPQGFSPSSKRLVRATAAVTPEVIREQKQHAPKRADLLEYIFEKGGTFASDLQKRTTLKNINSVLNDLVRAGLIETEEHIPHSAIRPKTAEFIRTDLLQMEKIATALDSLPSRKKKARSMLQSLLVIPPDRREGWLLRDFLMSSGGSLTALKDLIMLGLLLVEKREITREEEFGTESQTLDIVLNASQQGVLAAVTGTLDGARGGTFLLHGVTGSGKTQVYIEAIRHCLAQRKSAIVLVPEISLTPQMVRRFKSHFADDVVVVHSRMSAGERYDAWRRAYTGKSRIVIGPRSAVFAPVRDLGLIVVDEEHESSYKQFDSSPRYHARDVAVVRGNQARAVVLLGSATPSAESYFNATAGKYVLLEMPERIDRVPMPVITIVDMTVERKQLYSVLKESLTPEQRGTLKGFTQPSISRLLKEKIHDRLTRREGIILLQNRRGFAPFVECAECGYVEMCDNCNVTLTYHLSKRHLRCHYCGLIRTPHTLCPSCNGTDIKLRGIGTQKVEEELTQIFPGAKVLRMDLDTTSRRGAHDRILRKFGDGGADILLGTQMVAKGLDFARVTLVGVISADTQMLLPDFRASERTFQLLTQVAGRAGRSVLRGEVVIQTHQAGHYTLAHVIDHDFKAFYEEELKARQELDYPPYARLALIETKGENEEKVQKEAERFAAALQQAGSAVSVLGPAPAVIGKINKNYRWHVIIKSRKEQDPGGSLLHKTLQAAAQRVESKRQHDVHTVIDVDPVGLM